MREKFFKEKNLLTAPSARAAYSDRTAWIMAECSRIAYIPFERNLEELKHALNEGGFKLLQTFDKEGTQAYLASRDDFAVLVFRGTENKSEDIITDLKTRFYKSRAGHLHEGFYSAYQLVESEILKAVNSLGSFPLYITGHSLGAALASIATWKLDRDSLAACYTFGSPRVGDKKFDMHLKAPVYRLVNNADIVTQIPLVTMNYAHVGSLYYLTQKGVLVRSPSWLTMLMRFLTITYRNITGSLTDHSIQHYCQKLEAFAIKRNPQSTKTPVKSINTKDWSERRTG